jgi:hypothetical protein
MSIVIEQTPDEVKHCLSLVRRAEMERVRLIETRARCFFEDPKDLRGASVSVFFRFRPLDQDCTGQVLRIRTAFEFKARRDGADEPELIGIACKFEAVYTLAPGYQPTEDEIEAFRKANGVFNCWPFFREYVQSTVTRMDCPAPPVPFLKLRPKMPRPLKKKVEERRELAAAESGEGKSGVEPDNAKS